VAAIALATIVPLLWPALPPLIDLPGHMVAYKSELDRASSPYLQQWYSLHWAPMGNLGVNLLILPLGRLLGLEPAMKLIVLCIPPMLAGGFLWIAREVHGRVPPTALFAVPLAYCYPFVFGFLNFMLSMALGLRRLCAVAEAGPARALPAEGGPVRPDLDPRLARPHVRLGDIGTARLRRRMGARERARPPLARSASERRPPLPAFGAADRPDAGLALGRRRRRDPRLVRDRPEDRLHPLRASRPLGVDRHPLDPRRARLHRLAAGQPPVPLRTRTSPAPRPSCSSSTFSCRSGSSAPPTPTCGSCRSLSQ
jgi:hypothetical protein